MKVAGTTYVFLDTNIYVTCALMQKSGHDHRLIGKLAEALGSKGAILIVPEVVEAELERNFVVTLKYMREALKTYSAEVGTAVSDLKKHRPLKKPDKELDDALDEAELSFQRVNDLLRHRVGERKDSLDQARRAVRKLFKSALCQVAPLTPVAMTRAMVSTLRGESVRLAQLRAQSDKDAALRFRYGLEGDCLILESLSEFIQDKAGNDDQLLFCSDDRASFFTKEGTLRQAVAVRFPCQVTGYTELPSLLSAEFHEGVDEEARREYRGVVRDITGQFAGMSIIGQMVGQFGAQQGKVTGIAASAIAQAMSSQVRSRYVVGEALKKLSAQQAIVASTATPNIPSMMRYINHDLGLNQAALRLSASVAASMATGASSLATAGLVPRLFSDNYPPATTLGLALQPKHDKPDEE